MEKILGTHLRVSFSSRLAARTCPASLSSISQAFRPQPVKVIIAIHKRFAWTLLKNSSSRENGKKAKVDVGNPLEGRVDQAAA
jgi:hypothetical protein